MSIKLYQIPQEWELIMQALEEACGEMTPETEASMLALIETSKDKLTSAGLAFRNLGMQSELALAQAQVFQDEANRCKAIAQAFDATQDRLGDLMAPALDVTGKIKTPAGTLYTMVRKSWAFDLKPGVPFGMLDEKLWRQKDPELNKVELKKLAEAGTLPEEIIALSSTKTTTVLKAPTGKKDTAETPAA